MSVITVLGAGWLGFPLARHLAGQHTVYASKTSLQGLAQFEDTAVHGFVADLSDLSSSLEKDLKAQKPDTVIGCFPPGFRNGQSGRYIKYWQRLTQACIAANVTKLIMISTTGVYPNVPRLMQEEDASLEQTVSQSGFSDKSQLLLEAEQVVIDSGINYVIIRCGGLFGPGRHPARFVTKLKAVSQSAPVNMLHLKDAIATIEFAQQSLNNEVINAVCPVRPSKAVFYLAALTQSGQEKTLPPVTDTPDKRISADKLQALGFRFNYLSPVDALPYCQDI